MKKSTDISYTAILTLAFFLCLSFASMVAQTDFVKHAGNPILPLGTAGEWDDTEAAFADVLYDGSMYHMWYSGAPQENTYRIGYAASSDGINWIKPVNNPVLDVGTSGAFDEIDVWLPTVLFDGSQYEMWYTGNVSSGGIGYATATDPTVWTRHSGAPVLDRDGSSTWEQNRVLNPVVLRSDTLYRMWYSAQSVSNRWQTGYATSADGVNWSKHPNNPVLNIGPNAWDASAAMAGTVLFVDGQYHMWYHGTSGDAFSGWKIGYATSPDGVNWTKHPDNPILEPGSGSWDSDIAGFPRVIKDGNRYRMWYSGRTPGSIDRFGYAEDFSNAAHTDSMWVSHKYVLAGSETIAIYAKIANPHSENLTARALIESDDGLINEAVELTYYAGPVENLWRGFWDVSADAHHFSVSVELTNHNANYIQNSFEWGIVEKFRSQLPSHMFTQTASINDGGDARSVAVTADSTVFLANWNDGLRAYSYDGSSFTLMASANDGGTASDVALSSDNTVFLANKTGGLRAYVYDGNSLTNTAHVDDGGEARAVAVAADGTVFLANWRDGLRAYSYDGNSFTNTAHVNDSSSFYISEGEGGDVTVTVDGIVLLAQGVGLRAYSYDGASFTNIDSVRSVSTVRGVAEAADGTIFLSSTIQLFNPFDGGLESFSFDGTAFTRRATITDLSGQRLTVADSTVFLANWRDGLRAYSYNDTSLINTAHINVGEDARGVAVGDDGTVFLANGTEGLFAYNYSRIITSVTASPANTPLEYTLSQNYPNPFNPSTTIEFTLMKSAAVTIKVFDILGKEIATLVDNEMLVAGNHQRIFDARHLASGIYLYQMQAGSFEQTRKLVLLK